MCIGRATNVEQKGENSKTSKSSVLDIPLDKTPTDDEIDMLWDKVRGCLLDSPATSIRSAPADIQHETEQTSIVNGLPPKQPIKKVASNKHYVQLMYSCSLRHQQIF